MLYKQCYKLLTLVRTTVEIFELASMSRQRVCVVQEQKRSKRMDRRVWTRDGREWLFTFPLPPILVQSISIPSHSHSQFCNQFPFPWDSHKAFPIPFGNPIPMVISSLNARMSTVWLAEPPADIAQLSSADHRCRWQVTKYRICLQWPEMSTVGGTVNYLRNVDM